MIRKWRGENQGRLSRDDVAGCRGKEERTEGQPKCRVHENTYRLCKPRTVRLRREIFCRVC